MIPTFQQGQLGRSIVGGGASAGVDPFFANVVLLMHGDGTNGATSTVDSSSYARTISSAGSPLPTLSSAQAKFGATSMAFTGTGNSAFTCAASADTQFGTGDFTVEFWLYLNSITTSPYIVSNRSGGSGGLGWYVNISSTGGGMSFGFDVSPNTVLIGTPPVTAWAHIAICRSSGFLAGYINGVQNSAGPVAHTVNYTTVTRPLSVGRDNSSGNNLNGYVDDLRITKGVARYTGSFTPPTAAFPNA